MGDCFTGQGGSPGAGITGSIGKRRRVLNTESKSAKQKGKLSAFEPFALMAYDIAATFIAVFVSSWGTQHWATISGAAGACPAILVLALVNVVVFWFFHMYSSLWRYASISEAGRIVAAVT